MSPSRVSSHATRSLAVLVAGALLALGCATSVELTLEERAFGPAPADSSPGSSPSPTAVPELPYDEAIDVFFADVERFWAETMPETTGLSFEPVADRVPYDPEASISVPACGGEVGPLDVYVGNAFYCAPDDYIAWDDAGLFPQLYRDFGDFTVGLVIAHEYAHAVQVQSGVDGPTIFVELQADCMAGAYAGSVALTGSVAFERTDLDSAIRGFLSFADPRGTPAADPGAHGTAFDRLRAFTEGLEEGALVCVGYIDDPPQTAAILLDPGDENDGDLPLDELLPLLVEDLQIYLGAVGAEQVRTDFSAPGAPSEFGGALDVAPPCDGVVSGDEDMDGPSYYCRATHEVHVDRGALEELWGEVGDFAPAYAVAHSYAVSLVDEFEDHTTDTAILAADCLVGVWARAVFDESEERPAEPTHVLVLSAGDLDEAIVGLLVVPPTGPNLTAPDDVASFDRVAEFGRGFFRGMSQCRFFR